QLRESYAGLERKVDERTAELKQALDFQQASGEILASISGSISDAQPVFDAIARNTLRLVGSRIVVVQLVRGDRLELVALQGHEGFEKVRGEFPAPLSGDGLGARTIAAREPVQVVPIIGNPEASERSQRMARNLGYNALIGVPMMREDKAVGVIVTGGPEAVPFTGKQLALLKAFADQAVIAIENARLVNETKESL